MFWSVKREAIQSGFVVEKYGEDAFYLSKVAIIELHSVVRLLCKRESFTDVLYRAVDIQS